MSPGTRSLASNELTNSPLRIQLHFGGTNLFNSSNAFSDLYSFNYFFLFIIIVLYKN
jgi:hypothetical protein